MCINKHDFQISVRLFMSSYFYYKSKYIIDLNSRKKIKKRIFKHFYIGFTVK